MRYTVAAVDSLIIYFADAISSDIAREVRSALHALRTSKAPCIIDIIPSYASILVQYDFLHFSYEAVCEVLDAILKNAKNMDQELEQRQMVVPVFYDVSVGLDLERVAEEKGLGIAEVIDIHSKSEYFVYAIGFAPGFPYMGDVDAQIATPRVANPRAKIPKGSVAIADAQTAIYPKQSPGGWNILGRTPLEMFDRSYEGLSYLRVGDRVRFEPIGKAEFLRRGGEL